MKPRKVPEWNQYHMNVAKVIATKSKDQSTQVGCRIVTKDNTPISSGYNGMVKDCDESHMTWERPMKYEIIIHAEMNAILFAKQDLTNAKLYCTHHPCVSCLKHILQAGIREIYYHDNEIKTRFKPLELQAIESLLESTNTTLIQI